MRVRSLSLSQLVSVRCSLFKGIRYSLRPSTVAPVIAALSAVLAPASRLSALRENDAPTGKPPETELAMFATPWARNSRFGLQSRLDDCVCGQ